MNEMPAVTGKIRIVDENGHLLGITNDYPAMTGVSFILSMAIGNAVIKVGELIKELNTEEKGLLDETVLTEVTLHYFAEIERSGKEIDLRPPKEVVEFIEQLCDARSEVLETMGLRVTPLVADTFISLVVRTLPISSEDEEGDDQEESGELDRGPDE